MRVAVAIEMPEEERAPLESYARGRSTPARLVLRAKVVLQAAKGLQNKDIAEALGTLQKTVGLWRNRFATLRLAGIKKERRTRLAAVGRSPSAPRTSPTSCASRRRKRHRTRRSGALATWQRRRRSAPRRFAASGGSTASKPHLQAEP